MNYHSCHPKSCWREIPYLDCTTYADLKNLQSKQWTFHFHHEPIELIQSLFERVLLQNRSELLLPKSDIHTAETNNLTTYQITTHHPIFREVNNIVSRDVDRLHPVSFARQILQANIIRGFRRFINLRDHLVRSRIIGSYLWLILSPTMASKQ